MISSLARFGSHSHSGTRVANVTPRSWDADRTTNTLFSLKFDAGLAERHPANLRSPKLE